VTLRKGFGGRLVFQNIARLAVQRLADGFQRRKADVVLGVTGKCPCGWLPAQPAWCFDYYEIDAADLQ